MTTRAEKEGLFAMLLRTLWYVRHDWRNQTGRDAVESAIEQLKPFYTVKSKLKVTFSNSPDVIDQVRVAWIIGSLEEIRQVQALNVSVESAAMPNDCIAKDLTGFPNFYNTRSACIEIIKERMDGLSRELECNMQNWMETW